MTGIAPRVGRFVVAAVPLAFLAAFFIYPLATLLARGLADDSWRLGDVLTEGSFLKIIWFTIWQAFASTALTLVVALPLTWVMANFSFRGRRLVRALVTVPFVLPTVVVGGAFVATMDRFGLDGGTVRLRHTVWIVLIAHAFFNVAVIVRTVGGYWQRLDDRPEQVARSLGASPWRTFREVTLPRLRPSVLAASSIVFLFTFTSFAIILILGGPRRRTIETEIFRWAVTKGDTSTAAALAIVQLIAVVAMVALNSWLTSRATGRQRLVDDRARPLAGTRQRSLAVGAGVLTLGFLIVPIAALVERSLSSGGGYGFGNYAALSERVRFLPISALDALGNSLLFALAAAGIAVLVGGLASLVIVHGTKTLSRVLDLGLLLPLGTSAVTLGFGFLIALDERPLDLRSSWWIVPIAQALIAVPFVIRSVVPVLRAIDERVREAATSLGASAAAVRREIDFPIGARALANGAGFAFAISLGEFGATSFVGRGPDSLTVPLAIERLLSTPGDQLRGQAMALAVILMVVTALVVALIDGRNDSTAGVL